MSNKRRRNEPPSNLPAQQREASDRAQITLTQASVHWQGLTPHPADLERYEALYPGAAEIIFVDLQEQGRHRRELEAAVTYANIRYRYVAISLAFVALLAILATVIELAHLGATDAYLLGVAAVISAAGTTLYGIRANQKERELKREEARKALPPKGR